MAAVEDLTEYARAKSAARLKGLDIDELLNAYLAGFIAGCSPERDDRGYPVLRLNPDYPGVVRPEVRNGAVVLPDGWDDDDDE